MRSMHGGASRRLAALAVVTAALCCVRGGLRRQLGDSASQSSLPTSIGKGEGQLNLIAWEGYTQPQWVKPFEQQTGCKVQRKYAGSSDEMVTLMRSAAAGSTTWSRPPATRACA